MKIYPEPNEPPDEEERPDPGDLDDILALIWDLGEDDLDEALEWWDDNAKDEGWVGALE